MHQKREYLLSIIIPVYNVENYIKQCLESIFNQNYPNADYEVIIINDGTPDKSANIAKQMIKQKDNFYIYDQENKGLSEARNQGIKLATGKYIWFIDSDDWIPFDALSEIIEILKMNYYDIISMPLTYVYNNSLKKDFEINKNKEIKGLDYLLSKFPAGATQRYIIKKEYLDYYNIRFYPCIYHEDGDIAISLLYNTKKILILSNSYYNYRCNREGSIMNNWKTKNSTDLLFIYKRQKKYIETQVPLKDRNKLKVYTVKFLFSSISFAKAKWRSNEFIEFYKKNKKEIKSEAYKIALSANTSLKNKIKIILFAISPVNYYRLYFSIKNK